MIPVNLIIASLLATSVALLGVDAVPYKLQPVGGIVLNGGSSNGNNNNNKADSSTTNYIIHHQDPNLTGAAKKMTESCALRHFVEEDQITCDSLIKSLETSNQIPVNAVTPQAIEDATRVFVPSFACNGTIPIGEIICVVMDTTTLVWPDPATTSTPIAPIVLPSFITTGTYTTSTDASTSSSATPAPSSSSSTDAGSSSSSASSSPDSSSTSAITSSSTDTPSSSSTSSATTTTPPPPPPPAPTYYLQAYGTKIGVQGQTFYLKGANVYWLGRDESRQIPSHGRIQEMFDTVKGLGGNSIRSHSLGVSSGSRISNSLQSDWSDSNPAWESIDYAFYLANQYGIYLVVPLTDNYAYYHGGYVDFTSARGINKQDFWTNTDARNDFKNYIAAWLNHVNKYTGVAIKNDPYLGMIELGNELGNLRGDGTTVPTADWVADISAFIKSIDTNHLVLSGSDECLGGQTNDFAIGSLDVYSSHHYESDFWRIDKDISASKAAGKPLIIGEYSTKFSQDWYKQFAQREIAGSYFWSLYGHDDNGNWIRHEEEFTLYVGEESSAPAVNNIKALFASV